MERDDLETIAMRAVETTVLGRADPRLLVATRASLEKPKKTARLLAALSNSAGARAAVLLLGVQGRNVTGLDRAPDARWWIKVERGFTGHSPKLDWTELDIGGARILAVFPYSPDDDLITARTRGRTSVPWIEGSEVRNARTQDFSTQGPSSTKTVARIEAGRFDQTRVGRDDAQVDAFGGHVDLTLQAAPGRIDDADCAGVLILPGSDAPIELAVQIHPHRGQSTSIRRVEGGVEIADSVGARVFVAGARAAASTSDAGFGQLLLTIRGQGQADPIVLDVLLRRDEQRDSRWVAEPA